MFCLYDFNLFKLLHKPTRIKPPSATLLDNIYTNYLITVDTCKSGTLTSDISKWPLLCFWNI